MNEILTLRSLVGATIIIECPRCSISGELDRKDVVRRFKASASVSRIRRGIVGNCDQMCVGGEDRCQARLTSR